MEGVVTVHHALARSLVTKLKSRRQTNTVVFTKYNNGGLVAGDHGVLSRQKTRKSLPLGQGFYPSGVPPAPARLREEKKNRLAQSE